MDAVVKEKKHSENERAQREGEPDINQNIFRKYRTKNRFEIQQKRRPSLLTI